MTAALRVSYAAGVIRAPKAPRSSFSVSPSVLSSVVSLVLAATLATGCFGGGMESAPVRTGQNPRTDGVIDTVSVETGCPAGEVRIVAETVRRYVNETAFRFVAEGCGERFGLVEQCALNSLGPGSVAINDSLSCRFFLVSRVPIRGAKGTTAPSGAPSSSPSIAPSATPSEGIGL